MSWNNEMTTLIEMASFLLHCNAMDIEFSSGHSMEVVLALTPQERRRGLAFMNQLDISGMLFSYQQPTYIPFTMKDTLVDLDIAWYDDSGNLLQSGTYRAGSTDHITCPKPFSFVLETPAGQLPSGDIRFRSN